MRGFDAERYLGTWYEIARLDHAFERGLVQVSATYGQRDDGGIDVLNRGYDPVKSVWKEAHGRAYFIEDPGVASLKVSRNRNMRLSIIVPTRRFDESFRST